MQTEIYTPCVSEDALLRHKYCFIAEVLEHELWRIYVCDVAFAIVRSKVPYLPRKSGIGSIVPGPLNRRPSLRGLGLQAPSHLDTMCEMVFRYGRTPYHCDADWDGEGLSYGTYDPEVFRLQPHFLESTGVNSYPRTSILFFYLKLIITIF